jgi:hypothetical protein
MIETKEKGVELTPKAMLEHDLKMVHSLDEIIAIRQFYLKKYNIPLPY